LFLFAGLRSAIDEDTPVSKKTIKALEHAYVRAFSHVDESIPKGTAEGASFAICINIAILFTLALMEHNNVAIIDELVAMATPESLVLFLVDALYSPQTGLFHEIPRIMSSLENGPDVFMLAQQFDSHIIQPHIPRIANILSRAFAVTRDPKCLLLALDR
jgi:hypothetical protein